MFTTLTYQYRDSSNYKTAERVSFAGAITPEQEAAFKANLFNEDQFYPEQVGLDRASFGGEYEDDDTTVNEFCYFTTSEHAQADTVDERSIEEFIAEFAAHTWTDPHEDDPVGEFTTITTAEGYKYTPWTDGWAVGFKVTHPETGEVEFIYLNPSSDSDDGVATVFPYQGPTGEPGTDADAGPHHFAMFDGSPVADTEGTVKYPAIEVPVYSGRIDNLDGRVEWYLTDRRVNPARVEEFKTHVATLPDDAAKLAYIETWVTVRNA